MDTFGEFQKEKSAYIFSNEPLIFQSSAYHCLFQRAIESLNQHIPVFPILVNSAHEVAYNQFSAYFAIHSKLSVPERKKIVEDYFRDAGFGKISLRAIHAKGGYVETQYDTHAMAWLEKYGERNADGPGVSLFILGFLCGVTEAIFDIRPGTFDGRQSSCLAQGAKKCRFEVFRGKKKKLRESPGEGTALVMDYEDKAEGTNVDHEKVVEALLSQPLKGSEEEGKIEAFGQTITRHYANYFCMVAIRVLIEMEKKVGRKGVSLARKHMIEAGSVGALTLIAGLMQSEEWKSGVAPMVNSKEDTLHGILAAMAALGWGIWEADSLDEAGQTTFKVKRGFESNAFEKMVGKVKEPICYFLYGCSSGIMNLVYNADLSQPVTVNDDFYELTCKGDNKFIIKAAKTRMAGEGADIVTVGRMAAS